MCVFVCLLCDLCLLLVCCIGVYLFPACVVIAFVLLCLCSLFPFGCMLLVLCLRVGGVERDLFVVSLLFVCCCSLCVPSWLFYGCIWFVCCLLVACLLLLFVFLLVRYLHAL